MLFRSEEITIAKLLYAVSAPHVTLRARGSRCREYGEVVRQSRDPPQLGLVSKFRLSSSLRLFLQALPYEVSWPAAKVTSAQDQAEQSTVPPKASFFSLLSSLDKQVS